MPSPTPQPVTGDRLYAVYAGAPSSVWVIAHPSWLVLSSWANSGETERPMNASMPRVRATTVRVESKTVPTQSVGICCVVRIWAIAAGSMTPVSTETTAPSRTTGTRTANACRPRGPAVIRPIAGRAVRSTVWKLSGSTRSVKAVLAGVARSITRRPVGAKSVIVIQDR